MSAAAESIGTRPLSDAVSTLGEGPTYEAATDTVWWFDITGKVLHEHRLASGESVAHALPFMASQLSFVDDRRQLLFSETGLHLRDAATGRLTLHTAIEADNPATRSNDGRVHPSGALWIGTMGKKAETGAGAIYWFHRGQLRQLFSRISIPNAICFAPDGRTAYFTDTAEGLLKRVATDPETGLPTGEPATLYDNRGGDGGIDGAVVDAEGLIWNARWGGSMIDVYSPGGDRIRSMALPVSQPTCPVFLGAGADRIAVTSAREGLSEEVLAHSPAAGKTLLLDVQVAGRHDSRVLLT